jgi:hypothetical protein
MLYETDVDRKRELAAMLVLQNHFKQEFVQTKPRKPIDFITRARGYVCEHKYRKYYLADFERLGNVWLEKVKHKALIDISKRRGDTPLFVVSLLGGIVMYADVSTINTANVEIARRENYRCENDADPCIKVFVERFKIAGNVQSLRKAG